MTEPRASDTRRSHDRLDPEIKALRAILRALEPLDAKTRHRALSWVVASNAQLPWASLPSFPEQGPQ